MVVSQRKLFFKVILSKRLRNHSKNRKLDSEIYFNKLEYFNTYNKHCYTKWKSLLKLLP